MPLALAYTPLDPYAAWQAANGAEYCKRLSAIITLNQCEQQQQCRRDDYRCRGCAGLYNQDEIKQVRRNPTLIRTVDQIIATSEANTPPLRNARKFDSITVLDGIIDDLYTNPLPGDDFEDVELDLDDEAILALFPELATNEDEDNEINFPRFAEYQTAMPRYAVYKGRCRTCGGYMDNVRERHDDNVFRCLACGWRTGPEYEQNRNLQNSGMGFK